MTLEALFLTFYDYRVPIALVVLAAPWFTYLICYLIPGRREEPFVLSVNLGLAVFSLFLLAGYLAYAINLGGWQKVVQEADVLLLALPVYYLLMSLWLSRQRMPLQFLPAFRTLQGLAMMCGVFLALSWIANKIRIVLFSYIPFSTFLLLLAALVAIAYAGYRKVIN